MKIYIFAFLSNTFYENLSELFKNDDKLEHFPQKVSQITKFV